MNDIIGNYTRRIIQKVWTDLRPNIYFRMYRGINCNTSSPIVCGCKQQASILAPQSSSELKRQKKKHASSPAGVHVKAVTQASLKHLIFVFARNLLKVSLVVKIDALVVSREGKMCVDLRAGACRSLRSVDPGGREEFRGKAEARERGWCMAWER